MGKSIVIIGGGFGGVEVAQRLEGRLPAGWGVTLFSRENHFVFTPLLGEVVGASINPLHVVWPVRTMARRTDCRTAAVTAIDPNARTVTYEIANGRVATAGYDQLVIACGSIVNLDVVPGMAAHGWPVKTMGDALALRNHLIGQLEKAEVESDPDRKMRLLAFAVVGAGYSGVEVAGEIYDFLTKCQKYYRTIKPKDIRVSLIQSRDRILLELPESLGLYAHKRLTKRGVDIRLNARVASVTGRSVRLATGEDIPAGTIVCTIGNTTHPLITSSGLPLEKGRLRTKPDMRVEGYDNIWALGDTAGVPNEQNHQVSPPTAQFAAQQAKQLVGNLRAVVANKPTKPFYYGERGSFASIGHRNAVGKVYFLKLHGMPAWFLWRAFYLSRMPTLARQMQIAFDWFWDLFFPQDLSQLSTERTERLERAHFEPGEYIFRKGDDADVFYIIEKGKAGIYLDESQPPVATLGPGEHFGERALLRKAKRSASIKAEEPLDLITIGQTSFKELTGALEVLRTQVQSAAGYIDAYREFNDYVSMHPKLSTVTAGDVMRSPVVTLPVSLTFAEAYRQSQELGHKSYPVVDDDGKMVGICTATDLYNAVRTLKPADTPMSKIMKSPVIKVTTEEPLSRVMASFLRHGLKRLVVVEPHDPERPIGIVTPFDVVPLLTGDEAGVFESVAKAGAPG